MGKSESSTGVAVFKQSRLLRTMGVFASVLVLSSVMSGCALTAEKSLSAETTEAESDNSAAKPNADKVAIADEAKKANEDNAIDMDSQTMFEVMASELLLKRNQPQAAFNTMYGVAERYRTGELAARAFQMAMTTYNLRNIEKATKLWREVSPETARAWRASFVLSLRNDAFEEALQEFDKFQTLSEEDLSADLIVSASKVGATVEEAKGIPFFQALTEKYPDEWASFYALGMVSAIYKNSTIGIPALNQARDLMDDGNSPDSNALIFNLLSKLYLSHEPAAEGVEVLRPYVEEMPDDLLVQERLARLEVQAKLYEDAEKRYKFIVEKEPQAYTSQFSLALLQMERDAYDEAEQNLIAISKQKGYQSVAFYYLGILYQDQGKDEKALNYFAQVKRASYKVDANLHSAEILFTQGKREQAFDLLQAIDTKSMVNKIKVLRAKAIFYSSEDNLEKAVEMYEDALRLQPENINVLKAVSLLYYNLDQFTEYENALLMALKLDGNDSEVLNALGYYYVENRIKLDTAFILLERALKIEPESYFILDSMGWYYYQRGDFAQALDYLNRAFEKSKDEEVLIHLVATYWANGEQDKAKDLWQEFHGDFMDNDKVQNLIKDLEQGKVQ